MLWGHFYILIFVIIVNKYLKNISFFSIYIEHKYLFISVLITIFNFVRFFGNIYLLYKNIHDIYFCKNKVFFIDYYMYIIYNNEK